ncbi:MFS transporter [Asticcacaulis sp. EMRT-3]|uniref:MFS transporter n=1 Tax=Asticcacaulis sp. EMRT-3 TaxID=3040349 RepID=UPI0024AFF61C|nr:MFS transporter [Asticcacaulis sp. EMRT-3]MDI7776452.1 MFS transporter [Asticcacaulis sp. EMRT-3]
MEVSNAAAGIAPPPIKPSGHIRWIICFILFLAVVLSYIDRLVISVLKPHLAAEYHWSETGYADMALYFQLVYGIGFLIAGRVIDRIGAKFGYALAITMWTIGHMLQAAVTTTTGMIWARLPLALGEAATYPAALVAVNNWFPQSERGLAIGILNAGANVGAVVTPLLVPFLMLAFGWRSAFIVTGLLSFLWLAIWLLFYQKPRQHKLTTPAEIAWIESEPQVVDKRPVPYRRILATPQAWAYMAGRFLIDPVWWTFLFWLPAFFAKQFGVKDMGFGAPLVAIYVLADLGSIFGGWISGRFLKAGWSTNRARKTGMAIMAAVVLPVAFAGFVPQEWMAVVLIGLACAGHQGFSTNLFTVPGDLFPHRASGTVAGLGGLAGAAGGMLMAKFAGIILQTTHGDYAPIFMVSACAYFVALLVVHLICPRWGKAKIDDVESVAA